MFVEILFLMCGLPLLVQTDDVIDYVKPKLIVGKCRTTCIQNFGVQNGSHHLGCLTEQNWKCNMCWDYCDMLIQDKTRNQMCDDNICLDGCQKACKFYSDENIEKWIQGGLEIEDVNVQVGNYSSVLSWSYGEIGAVFVIFGSGDDGSWIQLNQTTENKIWIQQQGEKILNVTIFGLTSFGLINYVTKSLVENENVSTLIIDDVEKGSNSAYEWVILHWLTSAILLIILIFAFIISIIFKLNRKTKNVQSNSNIKIESAVFSIAIDS